MQHFTQDWRHCDQTSNYLAQLVGVSHPQAKRYINLLSTILNEMLEVIFRQNKINDVKGSMNISIKQEGNYVFTTFDMPVNELEKDFFIQTIESINQGDSKAIYQQALQTTVINNKDNEACLPLGLYDVVANYDVKIHYQTENHTRFAILMGIHYDDMVMD